jgi:hypothetical protein
LGQLHGETMTRQGQRSKIGMSRDVFSGSAESL